jgi:hypothetical protein
VSEFAFHTQLADDTDVDALTHDDARALFACASGLNIPIGVHPFRGGDGRWKAVVWSIPNIWYFADTDGDDRADLREVLFGPLGYEKDTHGMCSSFRLGLDGWVYATHGFNNTSRFEVRADRWRDDGKITNERIPNDERSPNAPNPKSSDSSFEPRHSFVIPHSSFVIYHAPHETCLHLHPLVHLHPCCSRCGRHGTRFADHSQPGVRHPAAARRPAAEKRAG